MSELMAPPARPAEVVAESVILNDAFEDPQALLDLMYRSAPYDLIYSKQSYENSGGAEPWFQRSWFRGGLAVVPEARPFFENPRLIETAKTAFGGAWEIRPHSLTANISGPMQPGRPHIDLSICRGIDDAHHPSWLRIAMHHSGLFMPWSVLQASALAYFFPGPGGGYEYWPEGPTKPSQALRSPLWNTAIVTDNDFMYHRAQGVGPREEWLAPRTIGGDSKLHKGEDDLWHIVDEGVPRFTYKESQLRLFVIWKAYVFKTRAEAEAFDNHLDDLSMDQVWDAFADDFRRRGLSFALPDDPLHDRTFRETVLRAYPPPGLRYFTDARRPSDRY